MRRDGEDSAWARVQECIANDQGRGLLTLGSVRFIGGQRDHYSAMGRSQGGSKWRHPGLRAPESGSGERS